MNQKQLKKLCTGGDLWIEVKNDKQAANLKKCAHFANIAISVSAHRTLNASHGVISE